MNPLLIEKFLHLAVMEKKKKQLHEDGLTKFFFPGNVWQ